MTATATIPARTAEMLRGYSIELNPGDARLIDAATGRLECGTEVSLTWIPGSDPMKTVAATRKLRRAGLIATPHVGARHLESAEQLKRLANDLAQAGVDRILLIAGDRTMPAGPFDSSLAVMRTGAFQQAGITRIAVAGFPEGNPNIPEPALNQALTTKVDFARNQGIQLSIFTQFCFKADAIVNWIRNIRSRGISVPVRVGLAGPAGLVTLVRYAVRCGIGNSLRALTENPVFAKALVDRGPEPIVRDLAMAEAIDTSLEIAGLHFYVFGGLTRTLNWIDSVSTGSLQSAHA